MSNDNKIKTLLETVETKTKEMGSKPKNSFVTNAIFKSSDKDHLNLNTVDNIDVLVNAYAFLVDRNRSITEAAEFLGVESHTFEWSGYSIEEWGEDFKSRIAVLNWNVENKKLQKLKNQLNGLISEDGKTELALEDIAKLLV